MLYKFHCNNCHKDIELNLKVDDLLNAKCNTCQNSNLNRIWSATPNLFKCEGAFSKINHSKE